MIVAAAPRRRPRLAPRILGFGGLTALMIVATVNEWPGLVLGAGGLGWVGALFALVHATQVQEQETPDSIDGTFGDSGSGDGGGDGGGD